MAVHASSRHRSGASFSSRPPDGRSRGTLSQAIREHLCRSGGRSTRELIRRDLEQDSDLRQRLQEGQGLERLLRNLLYAGFLTIDGEDVKATSKTLQANAMGQSDPFDHVKPDPRANRTHHSND